MIEVRANRYQQRFYLEWALDRGSRMYNTPLIYELEGELDEAALTAALDYFVNQCHPGCRSRFIERDGAIVQCLEQHVEWGLRRIDGGPHETMAALVERELAHGFDLERGPLFRFALLRAQGRRVLVLNFHHIVSDAKSAMRFVELLRGAYLHYTAGEPLPPPPSAAPDEPADLARNREDVAYWCELLQGRSLHVDLPRQVRSELPSADGESYFFDLDGIEADRLRQFCKTQRCTPFMVIAAVSGVVLGRYASKRSLVLNYPVDSRPGTARDAMGCFVNNVPLPLDVSAGRSLLALVEDIRRLRKEARAHSEFSLTEVVRELRERALTEENLFNVSVIEAYFDDVPLPLGTGSLRPLPLARRQVTGDLSVAYQPGEDRIRFRIDYRLDTFAASFIARLAESLCWAMSVMLTEPERAIDAGAVLSPAMQDALRAMAQGEPDGAVGQEGVMAMFRRAAQSYPDRPALHYHGRVLSYRDTLQASARVAKRLERHLVRGGEAQLIGVRCARKDLAVLCILGVLGAGAAYVPIDPKMPEERLREVCAESGMTALLTDMPMPGGLEGPVLVGVGDDLLDGGEPGPERLATPPAQALAYVIYTSGSTGKPKGVRIEHGKLGNAIADFAAVLGIGIEDRVVGATAVGFDIFGLELFMALGTGASLLLLDREVADAGALRAALDRHRPTVVQGTPSFWSLLAMADWRPAEPEALTALCGGEALSQTLAGYLLRTAGTVYQVYGPTETTIWSSRLLLRDEADYAVIGRPIGATRCHVMDESGTLLPWGACGELYIGGGGVSSGYHRRDDLTAERFPESTPAGCERERLYRTGDRVCWNERGELIYLGRLDFQVKVRGHRVELGEVEHALNRLAGVKQAVVCAVGVPGQVELAAYLVLEPGETANEDAWRSALRQRLPAYMIPRTFQVLDTLPQTMNGKVDRKALPDPTVPPRAEAVEPQTDGERELLAIWRRVLGNDAIGVTDHFMMAGGHSLLAAQMLIAAGHAFAVDLSFSDLLGAPTVRELAAHIAAAAPALTGTQQVRAARFPLSLEQRHLYFIDRYEDGKGHSFNLAVVQRLNRGLDVGALSRALGALVPRHDMLNVRIRDENGELVQCVEPVPMAALTPRHVAPEALEGVLSEIVSTPFDLTCAPLRRIELLQPSPGHYLLVLVLPHIVADGWSLDVLSRELTELYRAELAGAPASLPEPHQFYSHAVEQQAKWFASQSYRTSLDFWRESLAGYAGLDLPADFPATRERDFRGAHHGFEIDADLTAQLKALAANLGVSLFDCLYTVFALQLRRYCQQTDLVISVPAANRRAGNEAVVGLFTSMLPLRIALEDGAPFAAQAQRFSRHSRAALAHQGVPLEALRTGADGREGPSHKLLQVVFALQNANEEYALRLDGVDCSFVEVEDNVARYDLLLTVREDTGRLFGRIEYPQARFTRARIERMGGHFVQLARQAATAGAMPVGDYDIVTPAEAACLAPATPADAIGADSLVTCFGRSVAARPDAVALETGSSRISYGQLDIESDRLAKRLRAGFRRAHGREMPPETLIGLCLERGPSVVVAMLAILKAGGAYVPLDPAYPAARLKYMVQDSAIGLIVSTRGDLERSALHEYVAPECRVLLDEPHATPADEVLPHVDPRQLAYVIYTSGSTGNPKGALLTHANVVRLLETSEPLFDFSERDCWCLFHSYAFDFSVWEIWGALRYGARLLIVTREASRDPNEFRALLREHGVSVLNQTPSAFVRLIEEDGRHAGRLPLRYVIFGGEALQVATLRPWFEKYGEAAKLVNMYGITETTVHVSFKPVLPASLVNPGCNDIGRPLPDLTALVLDGHRRLCPVGVAGELYIAGPGVARGYLNQAELTERVFVRDPALLGGARLYKTGDLARWLENGNLEYLGRNDHQVKIRGFRIELGEVQAALMRLPQVANALAVHDRERDGIVLYYAAAEPLDTGVARARLREDLPEFMLPQRLVHVPSLPLTANGKVDVAALRELEAQAPATREQAYVAPRTDTERLLARVWEQVLRQPRLGADADFFVAGGDSLRVLDVIRLVREAGYSFSPRDLFRHPTIAQLAAVLKPVGEVPHRRALAPFALLDPAHAASCREAGDEDVYPLTALQEGMVFHSQFREGSSAYLDLMSCRVRGPFEENAFAAALERLVEQQPVLRTRFLRNADGAWQKVKQTVPLPLKVCRIESATREDIDAELHAFFVGELSGGFDLDVAPLWRITVHTLGDGFHLTLCCHHAILDGWSVATLLTTLLSDYDAALGGALPPRARPEYVFRDYVAQEVRLRQDRDALDFWLAHWEGRDATLLAAEAASADAGESGESGELNRHRLPIDSELHRAAASAAAAHSVSIDVVLLAAHLLALSRGTGQRSVSTGMASHGRLAEDAGHRMLGLFLNTAACSLTFEAGANPGDVLRRLVEYKAEIQPYANFPLGDIQRQVRRGPLFDTLFNFVNFHVFGQLGELERLSVAQGYCYEETNFALVSQTGIDPETGALQVELVHRTDRLSRAKVERFGLLFMEALRWLCGLAAGAAEAGALAAIFPAREWLGGGSSVAGESLAARAQAIADRYPDAVALRSDGRELGYRALHRWADVLAAAMRERHGRALTGARIGLLASREPATIAAMLAIVKLGAAYVPLDPAYPREHIERLLADAKPAMVAGSAAALAGHAWLAPMTLALPDWPEANGAIETAEPQPMPSASELAYVMYTSGSTGRPKGVMVEQAGIVRLVVDAGYIDFQPGETVAQAASLSFDAATLEVWGALLNGATLTLVPSDILLDGANFGRFLLDEAVDTLFLTTRLFDRYVLTGHAAIFHRLRYLVIGGDAMDPATVSAVWHCPAGRPRHLCNGYGPTENTTFTTVHEVGEASLTATRVPIGKPIAHTQVYVLDEAMRQVPIGVTGELYTAGAGLARGYLGEDARTAAAFIELALPDAGDATPRPRRLYRTGDAARWLPSGELDCLGRLDRTVKINGFRVDLGEVEAAARRCPDVEQCIAVVVPGERKQLALYVRGGRNAATLRASLSERLPAFMVPAHIVPVAAFVLNRNGKIDTAQLPPVSVPASGDAYEPSDAVSGQLLEIWRGLLGSGRIGPHENFFDCGGDSLLAMQLQHEIGRVFRIELPIVDVFRYPTIDAMAGRLSALPAARTDDALTRRAAGLAAQRSRLQRQFRKEQS